MCPGLRVVGAEDAEIGFEFLICLFGLSVGLRVVGSGEFNIIFQETGEFSCKCRGELGTTIRDEGVMKAKAFEYIVKKELHDSGCINGFAARSKNHPLCKAMVNYDHDRIKTRGGQKVGDEVDGELLERESGDRWYGTEEWGGGVGVDLVLLTDRTSIDKIFDKGSKSWPPVVSLKDGLGVKDAHMAREGRGVYDMQECRSGGWGNKHPTFKVQMTIVVVPVRESRVR